MRVQLNIKTPLFLFAFTALVLYFFCITVFTPHIGITVKKEDGLYYVDRLTAPGKAIDKGIRAGDLIISVDGKNPTDNFIVRNFSTVERIEYLRVRHEDGREQTLQFDWNWTKNMSVNELVFQFVVPWTCLLTFVAMSLFLHRRRKKDNAIIALTYFFLTIGVTYFSSTASIRSDPIARITLNVLLPLIPYLFMYFMNIYMKRYHVKFVNKYVINLLVIFHIIVCVVCSSLIFLDTNFADYFYLFRTAMYLFLSTGYLICLFCLIRHYIFYRKTQLNALFKIMLVSHAVAFTPFVMLNLIPLLIFNYEFLPSTFTTLFVFALPLSFMYLFTSNTLFDIDFILTRFKYYVLIAIIPAMVIMFFITIIESVNYEHNWLKWFQIFIVLYAGVISFLYLKEYIDHKAKPKLFKQIYNYQDSIDRFSAQLTRVMKRSDLEDLLMKEFTLMVPLSRYAFLSYNSLLGKIETEDVALPLNHLEEVLLKSSDLFKVSSLYKTEKGLILVVGKRKAKLQLIWVENKSNHTNFNVDELRWLKSITHFTSIIHENLYLIENLLVDLESEMNKKKAASPWVLRLLFCLSENERRRLASDLHDSALQDQLLWYRRLEMAMQDYKMSDDLYKELGNIREGLLDVIYQIRETCNELRPPLLKELGLLEAIESLIEHIQLQVNFAVKFTSEPIQETLNEEQITSIYRMVQELLRNTAKHARAKLVCIELLEKDEYIYLSYRDDGIGMDIDEMKSSFSHMGLSGLKERVTSLEGSIDFLSAKGKGFEVKIIIPVSWTKSRGEREDYIDSYLIG